MSRRIWKTWRPNSLIDALRGCKDFALERKNLSVERIADLMGVSADLLYKWLSNGRMPAVLIPTFELACGANFASEWLARCAGRLVLPMPQGKAVDEDIQELQRVLHDAVGALMAFYSLHSDEAATRAQLMAGMEALAFHHTNVEKFNQPELGL